MEQQLNPILFIEEWFMKDSFPKEAQKEYVALGFLLAHTQLLTSSEEVQKEAVNIKKLGTEKYVEGAIGRNVENLDNSFVQALSEFIKKLTLDFVIKQSLTQKKELTLDQRKQIYNKSAINIRGGESNANSTNSAANSNTSIIISIELGIKIYQLFHDVNLKKIQEYDNNVADNFKISEKGVIKTMSELEQTQLATVINEESEQRENDIETSDKLIVTSEVGEDITTGDVEQSIQKTSNEANEERELSDNVTSDKFIVTSEGDKIIESVKLGETFQTLEDYEFHDYANMLPMMADNEKVLLTQGILTNGQVEPILLYDNKIVDGRNRYMACKELKKSVLAQNWLGNEEDLVSYVFEKNINRRELDNSQRAMSCGRFLAEARSLAKSRQGQRNDLKSQIEETMDMAYPSDLKKDGKHRAAEAVAKTLKTNRTYINNAEYILKNTPDLVDHIMNKVLKIPNAYQLAKGLPVEEERAIAMKMFKEKKGTINAIIRKIDEKRLGVVDQSVESADIVITTRHDIIISVEYIKQLEQAYGAKVKVQLRRKPKELKS